VFIASNIATAGHTAIKAFGPWRNPFRIAISRVKSQFMVQAARQGRYRTADNVYFPSGKEVDREPRQLTRCNLIISLCGGTVKTLKSRPTAQNFLPSNLENRSQSAKDQVHMHSGTSKKDPSASPIMSKYFPSKFNCVARFFLMDPSVSEYELHVEDEKEADIVDNTEKGTD